MTYIIKLKKCDWSFGLLLILISIIEPIFELFCLILHNYVFYNISGLQFAGVSIGSLFGFFMNYSKLQTYLGQYLLMLPVAFCFAWIVCWGRFCRYCLNIGFYFKSASYVLFIVSLALIITNYRSLHILSYQMIISYIISALYWYFSTSIVWLILITFRLI